MKSTLFIFFLLLTISYSADAQFSRRSRDSINALNFQDHQLMMERLGIDSVRPGPSGNPEAPNAANTDESKAKTYDSLPDPLTFNNGKKVKNAKAWEKRRKELFEDFDREIYGRMPADVPGVTWEVVSSKDTVEGDFAVREQALRGHVDNSAYPEINVDIEMTLTLPANADEAVPLMIEFGWNWPSNWPKPKVDHPTWKEQLLQKGWGYAILVPTSYQADNGAGLRQGIIGLVNKGEPRKLDDWGALRAWAWGASRALDYFESNPKVDEHRVGIEGLSRYGKAALVAMVYEPRFAIGFIGSSGAGGAKLLRRNLGEQVENLAGSGEYHWFAPNFIKYAGPLTKNDLPVDAHEFIALCAPRPVFVSSGSPFVEGSWVDGKGMFLGGVYATPVYELLGKKGLPITEMPPIESAWIDGDIAFRQHAGGHTVVPNWPTFIQFASKYFEIRK